MTAIRILYIDDDADLREVVEISLGLDPGFVIRSCESGAEGLAIAATWNPDIILLDVTMPAMDGPTTLLALRENPKTSGIPVIFMTARAQARELDHFRSLGALGVIAKPFDPMMLAASVHAYLPPSADPIDELRADFLQRVGRDIAALSEDRAAGLACRDEPAVIVTDYFMPDGDAQYLLTRLRTTESTANIPVIVLSGRRLNEATAKSLRRAIGGHPGAAHILRKSEDTSALFETLREFCGFERGSIAVT